MEAQAFWRRLQCDLTLCTYVDSVNPLPRRLRIHEPRQRWRSLFIPSCAWYLHLSRASRPQHRYSQHAIRPYRRLQPPRSSNGPQAARNNGYPGRTGAVSPL
jgi:hypothetical protein